MDNAVYIVFSTTPTGIGQLIRLATRNQYNHVSLSFEADIHKLYSFARYHRTVPLYGGLVVESSLRYRSFSGQSRVKICRLPVEEPYLTYLHNYLERLWREREEYIYNTPAALASLVRLHADIPRTYTCASFIQEILCRCRLPGIDPHCCPTIRRLEQLLEPWVVYEGPLPAFSVREEWGEDDFSRETTTGYAVYTTARHFGRLAKRVLRGAA